MSSEPIPARSACVWASLGASTCALVLLVGLVEWQSATSESGWWPDLSDLGRSVSGWWQSAPESDPPHWTERLRPAAVLLAVLGLSLAQFAVARGESASGRNAATAFAALPLGLASPWYGAAVLLYALVLSWVTREPSPGRLA